LFEQTIDDDMLGIFPADQYQVPLTGEASNAIDAVGTFPVAFNFFDAA
jgi:hypothetical protein